jgi:hypothetical protein
MDVWKFITNIQHELIKILEELSRLRVQIEEHEAFFQRFAAESDENSDGSN